MPDFKNVKQMNNQKPLILASASPRRTQLLDKAGVVHEVCPSHIDEPDDLDMDPAATALEIARRKAMVISAQYRSRLILAADTIVVLDKIILGKPADANSARRMIKLLEGRMHRVITGVCMIARDEGYEWAHAEKTEVYFKNIDPAEIETYLKTDEPYDKAGGYAVQGVAGNWIEKIDGDRDNVIGLPVAKVIEELGSSGYRS